MERKSIKIYRDRDDNGFSYTVYIKGKCMGNYLAGDKYLVDLVSMNIMEHEIVEGCDKRE